MVSARTLRTCPSQERLEPPNSTSSQYRILSLAGRVLSQFYPHAIVSIPRVLSQFYPLAIVSDPTRSVSISTYPRPGYLVYPILYYFPYGRLHPMKRPSADLRAPKLPAKLLAAEPNFSPPKFTKVTKVRSTFGRIILGNL